MCIFIDLPFDLLGSKVTGQTFSYKVTIVHDEAVHAIFLCFLEAYQIAILKSAFLSAGLFCTIVEPETHYYVLA